MASEVPSIYTPNAIPRFLKIVQEAGIPTKVTTDYLKTVGFRSSNDRALIPVFKAIGFIDQGGVPTDQWRAYRNKQNAGAVLAEAIRKAYSSLFAIYPDAQRQDDEAIANWVRTNTSLADGGVERAVRTFKTLCGHAEFDAALTTNPEAPITQSPLATNAAAVAAPVGVGVPGGPSVNINIELHVPATNDADVYDKFFKSMKENLFGENE